VQHKNVGYTYVWFVPRCQVSRCQSQQFWWSRDVQFRVFSRPTRSYNSERKVSESFNFVHVHR